MCSHVLTFYCPVIHSNSCSESSSGANRQAWSSAASRRETDLLLQVYCCCRMENTAYIKPNFVVCQAAFKGFQFYSFFLAVCLFFIWLPYKRSLFLYPWTEKLCLISLVGHDKEEVTALCSLLCSSGVAITKTNTSVFHWDHEADLSAFALYLPSVQTLDALCLLYL